VAVPLTSKAGSGARCNQNDHQNVSTCQTLPTMVAEASGVACAPLFGAAQVAG